MSKTMELTIGGQTYEFSFGIGFVKSINPTVKRTGAGVTEDIGLQAAIIGLEDGDTLALHRTLMHANKGHKPRLTEVALDEFIDDEETDIDSVFEEVKSFFKSTNATKKLALALIKK